MLMVKRRIIQSLFGLSFLLGGTASLRADLLNDIAERLEDSEDRESTTELLMENKVHFDAKADELAALRVQMGIKLLEPHEFKSKYSEFDLDDLGEVVRDKDRIIIGKSVAVLQNVSPHYFQASTFVSQDFMKRVMTDTKNRVVDAKHFIIEQIKDFKIKITSQVQFASYDFIKKSGQQLDADTAARWVSKFELPANPAVVTSAHAAGKNISIGSHGGRMVSFYFALNDKDTLMITYMFLTIKKEHKMFLFWNRILAEAPVEIQESALLSLTNLRKFLSDL